MTLSTVPVTGSIVLPDGSAPSGATLTFTLSAPDSEDDNVLPDAPLVVDLTAGVIPAGFELWRNTEGLAGTWYQVNLTAQIDRGNGIVVSRVFPLGTVQVGAAGSYDLGALLRAMFAPAPDPGPVYITAFGRSLVDDADAAEARATLQLGGMRSRSFYASDAAFDTAAAADGLSFPTPYMTRLDLPPQSINIHNIGMVASNSPSDAANNVAAFQDAIDWIAGKTNGGALYGSQFEPAYAEPVYCLNATVTLKKGVSLKFGPDIRFKATTAMAAMLDSPVGAGNRLLNQVVSGGYWDGNRLADRIMRYAEFQNLRVGDDGMVLASALVAALQIGNSGASANPYEFYLNNMKIANTNSAFSGAPIGILAGFNVSDARFTSVVVQGYAYGVQGPLFNARFLDVHTWSSSVAEGQHLRGFDLTGGRSMLIGCQVDEPFDVGYYINAPQTKMIGCEGTVTKTELDTLKYMVQLGSSGSGFAMEGCTGNDRADARFAGLLTGVKSDTTLTRGNTIGYGPAPVFFKSGFPETYCDITVNPGGAPTINASENIASVVRTSDRDYTFNLTYPMPSTRYQVTRSALPVAPGDTVHCVFRDQAVGSFRIQTKDGADALVTAARIIVSAGR